MVPPIINFAPAATTIPPPPAELLFAVKVLRSKVPASTYKNPEEVLVELKPGRLAANDLVEPPLILNFPYVNELLTVWARLAEA